MFSDWVALRIRAVDESAAVLISRYHSPMIHRIRAVTIINVAGDPFNRSASCFYASYELAGRYPSAAAFHSEYVVRTLRRILRHHRQGAPK